MRFTLRSDYRKFLPEIYDDIYDNQAERKSHRKYLRWDLRCSWVIVNIIVFFGKYLR